MSFIYQVILTEEAENSIKESSEYYYDISFSLYQSYSHELSEKIQAIRSNPLHFQVRYKNIRIAHLKRFPFSIHFFIDGNIIHVLNILHQNRLYK